MRSSWKIPFINKKYFEKCFNKKRTFIIKYKNSVIGSNFIDKKVSIYTGNILYSVIILSNMVGFKFGEFVPVKISYTYTHLKRSKKKTKSK